MTTSTDMYRQFSISTPLGPDKLLVGSFRGEERLSGLYQFAIEAYSEDKQIAFNSIVGKHATVTLEPTPGKKRFFSGIVTHFRQVGSGLDQAHYDLEIRPWLWLLTLERNSKIFQNQTVPKIIEAVFGEFSDARWKNELKGSYEPREYCVQYEESCFDFVSRLMEDEGIFYYFTHADGQHTLVLADDLSTHKPCPELPAGTAQYYVHAKGDIIHEDMITELSFEQRIITNKYAVDDFNFELPDNDLKSEAPGSGTPQLRVYEYPAGFSKKDAGSGKANRRLEALEWPKETLSGNGHCRAFTSGYKFTLTGHERPDININYVLSHVAHSGTQERYANTFEAFPATVPFRPPRTTSRPKIYGSQTALVVGKSGEEIWTDKYGRVKVQFHWDQEGKKNENSSCWIRVAHDWAGKGWGSIFIPRIGMEVVVSFLEGDPDRPLITGCVYNAKQTVPYTLPANQTQSTIKSESSQKGQGCFNEIRFEDKKDEEEIYVHAQKDQKIDIENDRTLTVIEGNETHTVKKGNRTVKVETGNETHEVKGTRSLTVTGNETHTNKANLTDKITGNHTENVTGNYTLKVTGNVTIDATGNLTLKSLGNMTIESTAPMTVKSSATLTCEGAATNTVKGAMTTVEGSAMLTVKGGIVMIN